MSTVTEQIPLFDQFEQINRDTQMSGHDKLKKYWDLAQKAGQCILAKTDSQKNEQMIYNHLVYRVALQKIIEVATQFKTLSHSIYSKDQGLLKTAFFCTCRRRGDKKHLACQVLDMIQDGSMHDIATHYAKTIADLLQNRIESNRSQARCLILVFVISQVFNKTITPPKEVEERLQESRYKALIYS